MRSSDISPDFYRRHAGRYAQVSHRLLQSRYIASTHRHIMSDLDLMDRMMSLVPPGSRGLDAGCGAGARDVYLYWREGYDIYGLDAVEENIQLARRLHPEIADRVFVADLSQPLKVGDASYDFVTCNAVIQHIPPETALQVTLPELVRVLRPGGYLQLMFKTGRGILSLYDADYGDWRSFQLYGAEEVLARLCSLGMEPVPPEEGDPAPLAFFVDPKPTEHAVIFARKTGRTDGPPSRGLGVLCFGRLVAATVLTVDRLPPWNTGATWRHRAEAAYDDATIVATLLARWGLAAELVASAVGDDEAGLRTWRLLRQAGVRGHLPLVRGLQTPVEVDISDAQGGRTFFWKEAPETLATLDDADLSGLEGASALYVDHYDAPHIGRPMEEARRRGVPVFLNLEDRHGSGGPLDRYGPLATFAQAVTDEAQRQGDALAVARRLREAGVAVALVTLADGGALALSDDGAWLVEAPRVEVVDASAAGATFSAAYLYGLVTGMGPLDRLRWAVAAASLKCTRPGPTAFPPEEIRRTAAQLRVCAVDVPGAG